MPSVHQFGGTWTEEKLDRLRKYLSAYMTIFRNNKWAQKYDTHYVDAFAGTGGRTTHNEPDTTLSLFDKADTGDVRAFYDGSARIALEINPPFDHYLFIEQSARHVEELEKLTQQYPARTKSISIRRGDANIELQEWCSSMDWKRNRAVVFLDPYGMSVTWETIEQIAATKAVDLWVLLPVGQAINRLLTKRNVPEGAWADKLTSFFGTQDWKDEFYQNTGQLSLFSEIDEQVAKTATFESITAYFYKRLDSIFEGVADHSLVLMNSRKIPLFVLFFAASNPRGTPTAIKIANDVLRG